MTTHANAALTPRHRLKVARLVVDEGWPINEIAAGFQVPWPTVKRWVDRYLSGELEDVYHHHQTVSAAADTALASL